MKQNLIYLQYVFYPLMVFFIGIFIKACIDDKKEKQNEDISQKDQDFKKSA